MRPVVLLVGRLPGVIGSIAEKLQDLPVEWLGAHDRDEVVRQLEAEPGIVCVVMGAGLDDADPRRAGRRHRRAPAGRPDPPQGAQLRARRHGALRAPDRRGHGAARGRRPDGGPGTEARRRRGAARGLARAGRRGGLGAGGAGARGAAARRARRAGPARRILEVHRPDRPDRGSRRRRRRSGRSTRSRCSTAPTGCGSSSWTGSSRRSCRTRRRWRASRSARWPRCWPPTSPGRASSSACSRGAGRTPVDRPLASLNTARAIGGRGDPRHRPGAAADQPRLSPQRRRRRRRWCIT